jgi:hypothetical protein
MEIEKTIVISQRLGKYFPVAENTRATIENLLDTVFSMQSVAMPNLSLWLKEIKRVFLSMTFFFISHAYN